MTTSLWFKQAVAGLAEKGHIEVNLVEKDLKWFRREDRRLVGKYPPKNAYNVAADSKVKGGSELRIVLDRDDESDRNIVERGLGIEFKSRAGGRGYRKGSKAACMRLIEAGLDIGKRTPRKSAPKMAGNRSQRACESSLSRRGQAHFSVSV